jgi:DNA-binding transcriptional LysR family regulator
MKAIKTNLNLYKTFIEVYETKNYSIAAQNLHLTQPTISYNVRELETQLCARLFNSNSRGVEPTKNADELYPIIKNAFVGLLNAENTIHEFHNASSGVIHICLSRFFMPQIMGEIIHEFNQKFPNIFIDSIVAKIEVGIELLDKHETDIMLYAHFNESHKYDKSKFSVIEMGEIPCGFYASSEFCENHNLKQKITVAELQKLPMLSLLKSFQLRAELEKSGLSKKPVLESNSTELLLTLANSGMGLIYAPDCLVSGNLHKISVSGFNTPRCMVAAMYNNNIANKAGSAFIDIVKSKKF